MNTYTIIPDLSLFFTLNIAGEGGGEKNNITARKPELRVVNEEIWPGFCTSTFVSCDCNGRRLQLDILAKWGRTNERKCVLTMGRVSR